MINNLLEKADPESWEWYWTLLLYLLGLGLLCLELIVPSGGILGLAAVGCLAYSLWVLFLIHPVAAIVGTAFLLGYIVWLACWGARRFTSKTTLGDSSAISLKMKQAEKLIGETGQCLTDLRPAGVARIAGQKLDVISSGNYIEAHSEIIVTHVDGNRIVVRLAS